MPILVGGGGERRLLRIVARHADAWNVFAPPEVLEHKLCVLAAHCREAGRDPTSVEVIVVLDPPRERRGDRGLVRDWLAAYRDLNVNEVVIRDSLLRAYGPGLPGSLETFIVDAANTLSTEGASA